MLDRLIILHFQKRGWRFVGPLPKHCKKVVIIYGPHSSITDYLIGRAVLSITKFQTHLLIRKSYFRFPFGKLLTNRMGIPFDHEKSKSFEHFVDTNMRSNSPFSICAPFKWRKSKCSNDWLHDIALKYRAPIVSIAFDYDKRIIKLHTHFQPSKNKSTEWNFVQTFLSRYHGKHASQDIKKALN